MSIVAATSYFEPDWQKSFWGSNYPRLRQIKDKYDPHGLFSCTTESAARTGAPTGLRSCLPSSVIQQYRVMLSVGYRRIFLLATRPGEGRFTQPTAAAQAWRPELVFMPHFSHSPTARRTARQVGLGPSPVRAHTRELRRQRPSTGGWRKRPVRPEAKFPKSRAIC